MMTIDVVQQIFELRTSGVFTAKHFVEWVKKRRETPIFNGMLFYHQDDVTEYVRISSSF